MRSCGGLLLVTQKRARIGIHNSGVHYADADTIMMIVETAILPPLRAEWADAKNADRGASALND